tara:strand:- start:103 stop:438 length:336 start_codon:yes stop_codon:yes gene_type:complete
VQREIVPFVAELKALIYKIGGDTHYEIVQPGREGPKLETFRFQPKEDSAQCCTEDCHINSFIDIMQRRLPAEVLARVELTAVSDGRSAAYDPDEIQVPDDMYPHIKVCILH